MQIKIFKPFLVFLGTLLIGFAMVLYAKPTSPLEMKGISYASWSREYPFTTSWKPQTFENSQAITEVAITTARSHSGKGSLEMMVDLREWGHPNKSAGEVFVDLRFFPPPCTPSNCLITPLNLDGVTIAAYAFAPPGSQGEPSRPNGFQLFVKSMEVVDGEERWASCYGQWHNIQEGAWNRLTLTPGRGPTFCPGFMDAHFNPGKIVLLGQKVGTGKDSKARFSGKVWLDDVSFWLKGKPQYRFENLQNSLDRIRATRANFVSLIVTWYIEDKMSCLIVPDSQRTPTDAEVVATIQAIHGREMKVLLKPHIDVKDGTWRGDLKPEDTGCWFRNYTDFIRHYAEIAEANGVELFAVGTEYASLDGEAHRAPWEEVINAVRTVYTGLLTYAANWDGYREVSLWDLVDLTGIDAYFPLSEKQNPSLSELINGWQKWIAEIETWQAGIRKPVVFAEIGYRSIDFAAQRPWDHERSETFNPQLQDRCYRAAFSVLQNKPWFKGTFWWVWQPVSDAGVCCDTDFTPQNKPAERTIGRNFR